MLSSFFAGFFGGQISVSPASQDKAAYAGGHAALELSYTFIYNDLRQPSFNFNLAYRIDFIPNSIQNIRHLAHDTYISITASLCGDDLKRRFFSIT